MFWFHLNYSFLQAWCALGRLEMLGAVLELASWDGVALLPLQVLLLCLLTLFWSRFPRLFLNRDQAWCSCGYLSSNTFDWCKTVQTGAYFHFQTCVCIVPKINQPKKPIRLCHCLFAKILTPLFITCATSILFWFMNWLGRGNVLPSGNKIYLTNPIFLLNKTRERY